MEDPARLLGVVEMEQGLGDRKGFTWQTNIGGQGIHTSLPQPPQLPPASLLLTAAQHRWPARTDADGAGAAAM